MLRDLFIDMTCLLILCSMQRFLSWSLRHRNDEGSLSDNLLCLKLFSFFVPCLVTCLLILCCMQRFLSWSVRHWNDEGSLSDNLACWETYLVSWGGLDRGSSRKRWHDNFLNQVKLLGGEPSSFHVILCSILSTLVSYFIKSRSTIFIVKVLLCLEWFTNPY